MTATASRTLFTLKDVAIKAAADATWVDIPLVMEASVKGSHSIVELMRDNRHQDNLYHTKKMQVVVKANRHAMAALEKVTGLTVSTSGSYDLMDLGRESELESPPVLCVRGQTRAIKADGTDGTATLYFFKTKCVTSFDEIAATHGAIATCTMTFDCFISSTSELNAALATDAFGRIEVPV